MTDFKVSNSEHCKKNHLCVCGFNEFLHLNVQFIKYDVHVGNWMTIKQNCSAVCYIPRLT